MKRVFIIFALLLSMVLKADAQIYAHKRVMDKFDDILLIKEIKTRIVQTDSTFIIEEKGNVPTEYVILEPCYPNSMGSASNVVNLIGNVYGYQESWFVAPKKDKANIYLAVHRVVTTPSGYIYENEFFWIQDSNDKRIVYIK